MNPNLPDPEADAQFYDGVPAKRLIAFALDIALVWGATILLSLMTLGLGFFVFGALLIVIDFVYRAGSLAMWSATPGMRLMGIELRAAHGDRFGPAHAVAHTLMFYLVLAFVIAQLISVVMMAGTRFGRGLHDAPLGSVMINRPV